MRKAPIENMNIHQVAFIPQSKMSLKYYNVQVYDTNFTKTHKKLYTIEMHEKQQVWGSNLLAILKVAKRK